MTLAELADEALAYFYQIEYPDGVWRWSLTSITEGPDWILGLAYHVMDQGAFLPENWRMGCLAACLTALAHGVPFEDFYPPTGVDELLDWLKSELRDRRLDYCNQALREAAPPNLIAILQRAQRLERAEIFHRVERYLTQHLKNAN